MSGEEGSVSDDGLLSSYFIYKQWIVRIVWIAWNIEKTLTIRNGYDKITFVAENGTENYRTDAWTRGRRGGGQSLGEKKFEEKIYK